MNKCKWGQVNCLNTAKCNLCLTKELYYEPKKIKNKRLSPKKQRADKRLGSRFEYENHCNNKAVLTNTFMTPNSGATKRFKGDEQISGLISVMEELKTSVVKKANGNKSFSIKREWLEKLSREAKLENKEFYYLKFRFHEDDENTYCVLDSSIVMAFIKTIVEDRRIAAIASAKINVSEKRRQYVEAENICLQAKIDLLEAEKTLSSIQKECDKN